MANNKNKIDSLSEKQEASFPIYLDRWKNAVFGNKRVDKHKAEKAVKAVYQFCELPEPEIVFCRSPYEVCLVFISLNNGEFDWNSERNPYPMTHLLGRKLSKPLNIKDKNLIYLYDDSKFLDICLVEKTPKVDEFDRKRAVEQHIWQKLGNKMVCKFGTKLGGQAKKQIKKQLDPLEKLLDRKQENSQDWRDNDIYYFLQNKVVAEVDNIILNYPEVSRRLKYIFEEHILYCDRWFRSPSYMNDWAIDCCWLDFCIDVLKLSREHEKWSLLKNLVLECGWFYLYDEICIVCALALGEIGYADRPVRFSLDEDNSFHSLEKPALEFTDGFKIYAFHGCNLPEKYGKVHHSKWKTEWFLKEEDDRLMKMLFEKLDLKKITTLQPEEESLIPFYFQKWKNTIFSTKPINRQQAKASIQELYQFFGKETPQVLFFDSPYAAFKYLASSGKEYQEWFEAIYKNNQTITKEFNDRLCKDVENHLEVQLERELLDKLDYLTNFYLNYYSFYKNKLNYRRYYSYLYEDYNNNLLEYFSFILTVSSSVSFIDFCISVLGCIYDAEKWNIIQSITNNCGEIVPFEKYCLVIDRPTKILLDKDLNFHSENEAALEFSDGFKIYARHGEPIPKQDLPPTPNKSQREWLSNQEGRFISRSLIQTIGIKPIATLTPQQENLVSFYAEKWNNIIFSALPVDRQAATASIAQLYQFFGKETPQVLFFDSVDSALKYLSSREDIQESIDRDNFPLAIKYGNELGVSNFRHSLAVQLEAEILDSLEEEFIERELNDSIFDGIYDRLTEKYANLWDDIGAVTYIQSWTFAFIDFCISELNSIHNSQKWQTIQSVANYCGWVIPFENFCIVCALALGEIRYADRPIKLCFDNEHLLHSEGTPAIEFSDGFSLYSYHGVPLPEKYGKIHPDRWKSQWLLQEKNAELRRVLIQGIGYDLICSELEATVINSWQEYTLLRINTNIDLETIYLLKMTCPSTGHVHVLRVPPHMRSAREAVTWINWGIDPEEFTIQT